MSFLLLTGRRYEAETCTILPVLFLLPTQNARVSFVNNTAGLAGAAIYANDMSSCKWLGPLVETLPDDTLIFQIPTDMGGPFSFRWGAGRVEGVCV